MTLTESAPPAVAPPITVWQDRLSARMRGMKSSAIRELLKLTTRAEVISFAGGLPAPDFFPIQEIEAASDRILETRGREALQYGPTEGFMPLRELLVRHMARYGVEVQPANVLITSGSQQALDLVGKLLINPGDRVVVENPSYLGALQAFTAYQPEFLTVPVDEDGIDTDRLEIALRSGPKFVYVLPNFQNPAGVTLSLERRRRLIELASHYGVPIVEDDPYGQLRYEGSHQPPLVVLDAEFHGTGNHTHAYRGDLIYLGTLSKTLAPGLRIGWVVAPEEVVDKLVQLKQGADLHTATFTQMVAWETARGGFLDRHVRRLRDAYRVRRDAMLSALERHFPPGVEWTHPQGGLFLWITMPPPLDSARMLPRALEAGVAYVPGHSFHALGGGEGSMRMNFSYCAPEVIEEGVRRLGEVIAREMAGSAT
ncbi:MAG: PLP-dependent aminotransferase family protein [Thermoanaerobaculia bacterium]|nr:MAG: PLP-dependent aminotransferase family protein [Thermoanaerobaculia bacterium]